MPTTITFPEAVGLVLGTVVSLTLLANRRRQDEAPMKATRASSFASPVKRKTAGFASPQGVSPSRTSVPAKPNLVQFLARLNLSHLLEPLTLDGARTPQDLIHLTDDDLLELPVTPTQRAVLRVEIIKICRANETKDDAASVVVSPY